MNKLPFWSSECFLNSSGGGGLWVDILFNIVRISILFESFHNQPMLISKDRNRNCWLCRFAELEKYKQYFERTGFLFATLCEPLTRNPNENMWAKVNMCFLSLGSISIWYSMGVEINIFETHKWSFRLIASCRRAVALKGATGVTYSVKGVSAHELCVS